MKALKMSISRESHLLLPEIVWSCVNPDGTADWGLRMSPMKRSNLWPGSRVFPWWTRTCLSSTRILH